MVHFVWIGVRIVRQTLVLTSVIVTLVAGNVSVDDTHTIVSNFDRALCFSIHDIAPETTLLSISVNHFELATS